MLLILFVYFEIAGLGTVIVEKQGKSTIKWRTNPKDAYHEDCTI
jgi:hypothetical protein